MNDKSCHCFLPARFDETKLRDWRNLLNMLPAPCERARRRAELRNDQLTKPRKSLGRLEEWAIFLASWQQEPRCDKVTLYVFAGNHGVAQQGVSAYPSCVTAQMVENFKKGGAAINQLVDIAAAHLEIHPLCDLRPTGDFTQGEAMDEASFCAMLSYGFSCVRREDDCIALGEMGIGNSTSAAALCYGLYGGEASSWVGAGTGVRGANLDNKIKAVQGITRAQSPLEQLRLVGGYEMVAIAGAIIAARLAHIPVILDGFVVCAAASALFVENNVSLNHCLIAHRSAERGHDKLLDKLNIKAMFDLRMALGEGSGAALAIPFLRAAAACHRGMASFSEAGVDNKKNH